MRFRCCLMSLFFALFLAKRTKDFINLDFARCCISQKEIERRNGPETSDLSHRTCFLAKEFHIFFSIHMWHVFDLLCHRYNHFLRETPLATHPLSYIIIQLQQNILIHAVRNQVNFFKRSFDYRLHGNDILRFAEKVVIDSSARIS